MFEAGGTLIFLAFIVLYLLALMHGLYSRAGSGINQHPYRNRYSDAPGAFRSSVLDHDHDASSRLTMGRRRRSLRRSAAP